MSCPLKSPNQDFFFKKMGQKNFFDSEIFIVFSVELNLYRSFQDFFSWVWALDFCWYAIGSSIFIFIFSKLNTFGFDLSLEIRRFYHTNRSINLLKLAFQQKFFKKMGKKKSAQTLGTKIDCRINLV